MLARSPQPPPLPKFARVLPAAALLSHSCQAPIRFQNELMFWIAGPPRRSRPSLARISMLARALHIDCGRSHGHGDRHRTRRSTDKELAFLNHGSQLAWEWSVEENHSLA